MIPQMPSDSVPSLSLATATAADIPAILAICDQARAHQRKLGFAQWEDGYPSRDVIAADIAASRAYLIVEEPDGLPPCDASAGHRADESTGSPVGYVVIDPAGDPGYDSLPDTWHTATPYAAVHRLALGDAVRGRHLAAHVMRLIEHRAATLGSRAIRLDTGPDNLPMQRLLATLAYTPLGLRQFPWGPRLAYEKFL